MSLLPSLQKLRPQISRYAAGVARWFWALPAGMWVWAARMAWGMTLIFLLVLALVQWVFVARLHHYQGGIEQQASVLLGQSVRIGHLQGHWRNLNPGIVLDNLDLIDTENKPSLSLKQVAVFLSWKSLLSGAPVVDLLVIDSPILHIRRDSSGKITIAGFGAEGETDPEALQRLLSLRQLRIQRAEIIWEDQLRQAPPLVLRDVNFGLDNIQYLHTVHRFGLTALPPESLASRLDIRGEWEGGLESLPTGRLFAELISADLAAWKPWVNYQSVLTKGRGGVRLWAEHLGHKPAVTVDVGLAEVQLRPGHGVPEVDVGKMQGRFYLQGGMDADDALGFELKTQNLSAQQIKLDWPEIFPSVPLQLDEISAELGLKEGPEGWAVSLGQLSFANADAAGQVRGSYRQTPEGPRLIDLQGDIARAEGTAVWRYLPAVIGVDTRRWVRDGVLAGSASGGKWLLQGDLRKFPFHTPADGLFRLSTKVQGAELDYAKGWPRLKNINGDLAFEQLEMRILARDARVAGADMASVMLGPVEVVMPDLETLDEQLNIKGQAIGPTSDFLNYIVQSPVSGLIDHATRSIRATGDGKLELAIDLPVRRVKDVKVQGTYHVHHNEVTPLAVLPAVQQVSGKIAFSERGVNIPGLNGVWLGQPAHFQGGGSGLNGRAKGGLNAGLNFVATGGFGVKEYRALLPSDHPLLPVLSGMSGSTSWRADIRIPQGKPLNWQVTTDLLGISTSLPGPLNKSATRKIPTTLMASALLPLKSQREQWLLRAEGVLNGVLQFQTSTSQWQLEKGVLAFGHAVPKLPDSGLTIGIKWPEFRVEEWQTLLDDKSGSTELATKRGTTQQASFLPSPNQFFLETDRLMALGRQIDNVSVQGNAVENGWQMAISSSDMAGNVLWKPEGRGSVRADLKWLHLAKSTGNLEKMGEQGSNSKAGDVLGDKTLPALDIRVADFSLGDAKLGRLDVKAENEGYRWKMPLVQLTNSEGKLTGDAVWEMARGAGKTAVRDLTQLNFKLESADVGKFLGRLDYPGLVRKGSGTMSGKVSWVGRPSSLDFATLNGSLQVYASDGQFAKIESGTGKLIGLLSLQSLPRRFLLDFNDVFSDGFAFDKISGDLQVTKGILKTGPEPLLVEGAAAQILMQGETDLAQETQNLQVLVRPRFGGVASLGAAVAVNPVVGIASLLAQKILQDPLDRILSYRYIVTGTWSDPVVVKE